MLRRKAFPAGVVCVLWLFIGLGVQAPAQSQEPITVTVGDGTANPGDHVEIPVSLASGGTAPQTVVLWVAFDPAKLQVAQDYYERIQTDITGDPVRDGEGNVVTNPSPVRPESVLTALTYSLDAEVHAEGAIAISVTVPAIGETLPDGDLLTVAFEVKAGVAEDAKLDLLGLDLDNQMLIAGQTAYSSAADEAGENIPVDMEDGMVSVGCVPAAAPVNVTASTDRADAVEVRWDAVPDPNAEYRVFRSQTDDSGTAIPLGDAWQPTTVFRDITAEPAALVEAGGCFRAAEYSRTSYFYWVKARTETGCESDFSASAQGSRAPAKSATVSSATVEKVFPRGAAVGALVHAGPGQQLGVRLDADAPIDPGSVQVEVAGAGIRCRGYWVAGEHGGGWAVCDAPGAWPEAAAVVLRAWGRSVEGEAIGPIVRCFRIATGGAVEEKSGVSSVAAGSLPWLEHGFGVPYQVQPEGVYSSARQVALPVPEDMPADMQPELYYYKATERRWYPAGHVEDWLVRQPVRRGASVVFAVRHAATVQLGAPGARAVSPASAAAAPMPAGAAFVLALLFGVLLMWGRRMFRTG